MSTRRPPHADLEWGGPTAEADALARALQGIRQSMVHEVDRAFREVIHSGWHADPSNPVPRLDLADAGDCYLVDLEVPGCREDDVEVEAGPGALLVTAEQSECERHATSDLLFFERRRVRFSRRVYLPRDADTDATTFSIEHGVLRLRVPKRGSPRLPAGG